MMQSDFQWPSFCVELPWLCEPFDIYRCYFLLGVNECNGKIQMSTQVV